MKLFFINPPSNFSYVDVSVWMEPLGLAYISAVCRDAGHDVRIRDMFNSKVEDARRLFAELDEFQPDVVGFTAMTENFKNGLEFARAVKARYGCKVVYGGWHVSGDPSAILDPAVDCVVIGEGEETILEVLDCFEGKMQIEEVQGIAYKTRDGYQATERRTRIKRITSIPFPMREGLPINQFQFHAMLTHPVKKSRFLSVQASRGCPYKCTFCQTPALWGSAWTSRTPESVVDELEHLANNYGVNNVFFRDEEFTVRPRWVVEICNEIVRRGMEKSLRWGSFARVDDMSKELVDTMYAAGSRYMVLGLEATDTERGAKMKKHYDIEEASASLRMIADKGITISGGWIIGFPWDTPESLEKSFQWLLKQPIDMLGVFFVTPFAGTEFRRQVDEQGLLLTDDTDHFNIREATVKTPHIPTKELYRLRQEFTRRYYLRPAYVGHLLKKMYIRPELIRIIPEAILSFAFKGRLPNMLLKQDTEEGAVSNYFAYKLPAELYRPLRLQTQFAA
ncbi:MAG: cobalamin-dependent protein [Deltaproteobacteria bacterium]|nr:cobalamin-dependent protein [Deltaproteobacteria bacterium]